MQTDNHKADINMRERITNVLKEIGLYSDDARELIMGTFAQESNFKYVRQIGGGPALGFCQMEPATFNDIIENFLRYKPVLMCKVVRAVGLLEVEDLVHNVELMIAMTRIHYLRVAEKLPSYKDVPAMARYWKKYYNTPLGKGTEEEFINNYYRYCQ